LLVASTAAVTPSERKEAGKAARAKAPRSIHGTWQPAPDRPDPVETLANQDATRVPELVPIRHGRMLASSFTFYRGAAAIMAADLGAMPNTGLEVQLCGDAHLSNFGVFLAPDRRLIFDVNDFDETLPGPFEWDVKRLAASLAVAGRSLGFKRGQCRSIAAAGVAAYREEMRRLAAMRDIDVWYSRIDAETIEQFRSQASDKAAKRFDKNVAKAEHKDSLRALAKLAWRDGDALRIVSDPPLIVPIEELAGDRSGAEIETELRRLMGMYLATLDRDILHLAKQYDYADAARKVVGVGSVGTQAWILLLIGRDSADPLFMQVKEAQRSVLEPFARASQFKNQGRRVVEGQRLTQAASDVFLGWLSVEEGLDGRKRDFYVRQLWDGKGSAEIETMDPAGLRLYATLCGWALAKAHARSGDRIAIASYLGGGDGFDRALCDFSEAYAEQNERDFKAFSNAVDSGRLAAELNV
jgi:uncharacterized protein (DUF2252 family)